MQINSPAHRSWLQVDIDNSRGAHVWEDRNLPPPTYVAVNPANGHAQYGYALSSPICVTEAARVKPMRYLAAIEYAFNLALGADRAFRGPLAKNPLHPTWYLWQPANDAVYELGELAEYVDLPRLQELIQGKVDFDRASLGRNCYLFEELRTFSYRAVRQFWRPGGFEQFLNQILVEADSINRTFVRSPGPLSLSEVRSIARSVARWVWKSFSPGDFVAIQRARGIASGAARREASKDLRDQAVLRAVEGTSTRQIAAELGVNQSTVVRWLKVVTR